MKSIFGKTQRAKDGTAVMPDAGPLLGDKAQAATDPGPAASAEAGDRWVGYIDHVERSVITGWCFDRDLR